MIHAETLEQYAAKCDKLTESTVPGFDCDKGTEVPDGHHKGTFCDRPQQLKEICDPGSRFQVLTQTNKNAYVVAHCRKGGLGEHRYNDIAVIQYNKKNGN